MTLERSSYTDEKYTLYVAYQTQIHHDDDNTPSSFRRFLVQSPLVVSITGTRCCPLRSSSLDE